MLYSLVETRARAGKGLFASSPEARDCWMSVGSSGSSCSPFRTESRRSRLSRLCRTPVPVAQHHGCMCDYNTPFPPKNIASAVQGTRFNATKDQAGTYYSTKIWQFSMKCPSCSTVMIIKTDPKNTDYEYVEGIRKKDMAFDPEEAETQRVQDSEVSNKLAGTCVVCVCRAPVCLCVSGVCVKLRFLASKR